MDRNIFDRRLSALENRCSKLLHALESKLDYKTFDKDRFSDDADACINELQLRLELCSIRSLRFLSLADDNHKRILDLEESIQVQLAENDLLEQKLEQAMAVIAEKEVIAKEAADRVELTMLQFRQVQEEFEHFFSLARHQANLLDCNEKQFKRLSSLVIKNNLD